MVDCALIEKEGVRGITAAELVQLCSEVGTDEVYLVEIVAKQVESTAMGVISPNMDSELGFEHGDGSPFAEFIASIMDDMDNESPDGLYGYNGFTVSLTR